MPIRLLLVDGRGPIPSRDFSELATLLNDRGIAVEVLAGSARPAPWAIFRTMEAQGVFPPAAVLVAAASAEDVVEAKNAGAWAVGVTDALREPGSNVPTEEERNAMRAVFLDAGADAVIDAIGELTDAIEALNGLM
jgi:beta-phosphoglucomutase-like phosphatase (HAD superfamily)